MADRPEMKFRLGNMTATIWRNEKFHSVVLVKSYKDSRGEWQETNSLNPGDLLNSSKVLERAEAWIANATEADVNPGVDRQVDD